MKRPEQHEIDTLARRQFESALPAAWVCRWLKDDYGIDAEVEVFRNGESTGRVFKVQLKGTTTADVSADGLRVTIDLPTKNLRYLCEELDVPTVIVIADVAAKITYWGTPLLDRDLTARLADPRHRDQASFAVSMETRHLLPATIDRLAHTVADMELVLGTRVVSRRPLWISRESRNSNSILRIYFCPSGRRPTGLESERLRC